MSPKEVLEFAGKNQIRQLDLRFCDIPAPQRHVSCPITELSEESFHDGFGVDGSRVRAWAPVEESDMLLIPDPATAFLDPFFDLPTLVMTCDVIDPITHQNHSRDPRWIAKKAEFYIRNSGVGDCAYFSADAEFFLFDGVRFDQDPRSGFHFVQSARDCRHLRKIMVETMIHCGLQIECSHPEIQGNQIEIGQRAATLLKSADNMMTYKYIARNVAARHDKSATFMPKPLFNATANSMHTHQSIWKGGEPIFAGDGYAGLSDTGLHYIGGLLKHAGALSAIVAPTTNSYKRLTPGPDAPVHLAYSRSERSAACRIPMSSSSTRAGRIEFRLPDPSSNPYLAFAAMLMAGLDGVLNRIDPGKALDQKFEYLPADERKEIPNIPESLAEALDCLEDDHDFLVKADVFSEEVLETYIEYKRTHESDAVRLRPHPHEFALYYDV